MKKKSQHNAKVTRFRKIVEKLKPVKNLMYDNHIYYFHKVKISDVEMEGIKAGLKDIEESRIFTHEEVNNRIAKQFKSFGLTD
ncbi:hypothetical protein NAF17_00330 [Mucilaginibacter sp. RB4R14]|uniref:hypothetical protein n=1 Tax=Mucilaginibacter aurantiaciroseus TaxID=2949308 RepID=UPI0020914891|nr:hypothetical protein [Mucilaginibacter aurantiaciroseus]MCO5933969.1 hypothetical protein [Mucilaginibacter aurantiaciroseus]